MSRLAFIVILMMASASLLTDVAAQSHFDSCVDGQGNIFNATIIIPSTATPTVNGLPLPVNSEVAVFSTDSGFRDRCVGVMKLSGASGAITVWGDDSITPERDGLLDAESFVFKIWDSGLEYEYPSRVISSSFPIHERRYTNDKTYILSDLSVFWSMTGVTVVDDHVYIAEDESVTIDVLSNDFSPDGDPLKVYQAGTPSHGSASISIDGRITYEPHLNFFGADSLTYYATGNRGNLGQGVIRIDIAPINDPPIIVSSPPLTAAPGSPYYFAVVGYDAESDRLEYISDLLPDWLSLSGTTSSSALLSGIPEIEDAGSYELHIGITDAADTTWTTYNLVVPGSGAENHAPQAIDDIVSVPEDSVITFAVLANDTDPDGDGFFVSDIGDVTSGDISVLADGQLMFTPLPNFNGTVSFTYTVSDSLGAVSQARVEITVTAVNDPPVLTSQPPLNAVPDSLYSYTITATDIDGDILEFDAPIRPAWLGFDNNGNGSAIASGRPTVGAGGTHDVTIRVTDGTDVDAQTFQITVPPGTQASVPTAPTILADTGEQGTLLAPRLEWSSVATAERYHVQVAEGRSSDFASTLTEDSTLISNYFDVGQLEARTWYTWRVRAGNTGGFGEWSTPFSFVTGDGTAPGDPGESPDPEDGRNTLPDAVQLLQNYPNPFNPETTIVFELPSRTRAEIQIFDILGHYILTLVDNTFEAGRHEVKWYASDLPSGIYVYRIRAGVVVKTRTLSLIK